MKKKKKKECSSLKFNSQVGEGGLEPEISQVGDQAMPMNYKVLGKEEDKIHCKLPKLKD